MARRLGVLWSEDGAARRHAVLLGPRTATRRLIVVVVARAFPGGSAAAGGAADIVKGKFTMEDAAALTVIVGGVVAAVVVALQGHELAAPDVHVAALVGSIVALAGSVARHLALPSPSPSTDLLASEDTAPIADPAVRRPRTATALPRPPLDAVAPTPRRRPSPPTRHLAAFNLASAYGHRTTSRSIYFIGASPPGHELAAPDVHIAALVGSVVALAGSVARHLALPSPSPSTDMLASEDTAPIADPAVRRPRTATALPHPPLDAVAPTPRRRPSPPTRHLAAFDLASAYGHFTTSRSIYFIGASPPVCLLAARRPRRPPRPPLPESPPPL
nr:leucine-rich repeat extensin-like protein 2 [Aegilops tauschii subsp. strangulata]